MIPGSGVNTTRFPLMDYPPDDTIVFNYIGRVLYEKGIDDYLEAARQIKAEYPNTEFNIIGFIEPTEAKYRELFDKCRDIVVYRGYHKDVRPFIARSHATIHPSKYGEGISNVLLESASSGRPLITTDLAGCRETVENGVTGFLYRCGDIPALVACIKKFLLLDHTKRREMGILGRKGVQEKFSRETVVSAYMSTLEECISRQRKSCQL